jgi:HK97 gp10 family phage protein
MKVSITIEGLSRCQAALRELPAAVGKSVVRDILIERAEPIAETVRSLAPVGRGVLQGSVVVGTRASWGGFALHGKGGPHHVEVFVGPSPDGFHGLFQEFGTLHHPPQPFLRPALDKHIDKVFENIVDDLWAAIQAALARRARKGR